MLEPATRELTATVGNKLQFSELVTARNYFNPNHWREVRRIGLDNLATIRGISTLNTADEALLKRYTVLRGRDSYLLRFPRLHQSSWNNLVVKLMQHLDVEDVEFNMALVTLESMMHNAQTLKREGRKPVDGDPLSDEAIWGYTQIIAPETQVHFVIGHLLERLASVLWSSLAETGHKDWLLDLMSEIILLNAAKQGFAKKDVMFQMWSTPKVEGGLGWISTDSLDAMRLALEIEE